MAHTLEYIIKLRDEMSKGMEKLSKTSSKALANTGNAIEGVTKASRTAAKSLSKISAPHRVIVKTGQISTAEKMVNNLNGSLDKAKNKLRSVGGSVSQWRKDFASDLPGSRFLGNPLILAGGAVAGVWAATQKAMKAGMQKMQLQVLTTNKTGAQLYKGLTKFATDTVFGSEVYGQATQMLANGIKSSEILPNIKMLGDISMGDANKLGQLSLALAQVKGKGHLAGQELLQLINAGFNPLQVISQKTGQSMGDLMDKMSKGQITFDDVKKSLQMATGPGGKFYKMLDRIASTPYGQLQNLQGQLEQMMIQMGQVFLPIASKLMQFMSWIGDKMGPLLQPAIAIIGGLAGGILAIAAAQWVWNAAQLANPITWVIAGVVALIALIAYLIHKIGGWSDAWHHTVNGAKLLWKAFTFSAKTEWDSMINLIMIGLDKIKLGWYKFKNVVGLGKKNENNALISSINADVEKRKNEIVSGAKKALDLQVKAGKEFVAAAHSFKWNKEGTVAGAVGKIKDTLGIPGAAGISGAGGGSTTGNAATKTNNAIATGGARNTMVNITIGNLVRDFKITAQNLNDAKEKIRDQIVDEITRAVAMGAALGS